MGPLRFASMLLVFAAAMLSSAAAESRRPAPGFSVALFGDLQIGYANWQATKQENPSSTNVPQLRRTLLDLKRHPRVRLGIVLGDLVMNEVDDQGQELAVQLDAWQEVYQAAARPARLQLLPAAGNHELNVFRTSLNKQFPSYYTYDVWLDWIARNGYDRRERPEAGGREPRQAGA